MEFGFWSVVPPIVTIALALITKNVFISLFVGIFLGYSVLNGGNLIAGLNDTLNGIVAVFSSGSNTIVIFSFLIIGAIIYIIEKSGGISGFVDVMVKKKGIIKSKRAANVFTWILGVLVFTSGSLSTMVVGSVTRPINDALNVPHEKSAFIVHTTSTPVCVLIPLSGWLAAMIGYLTSGGVAEGEAMGILVKSIGLNFYCLITVLGCLIICLIQKDFGPMKAAEKRAKETGALDDAKHDKNTVDEKTYDSDSIKPRMTNLVVPLVTLILTVIVTLIVTGGGNLMSGSGMQALLWGVFISLLVLGIITIAQKLYTVESFITEAFKGASGMLSVAAILVFGFAMGSVVKSLDTGMFLSSVFEKALTPALLPVLVFIMSCILSFSTGTSMGTMAIASVIAIPMAMNLGVSVPLVASAIWGGSIFGDHASPISDTTIMTCATTGCNIIDHVKTQIPYCIVSAAASIILYLVFGFVM